MNGGSTIMKRLGKILLAIPYTVAIAGSVLAQTQPSIGGFQVKEWNVALTILGLLAADGLGRHLVYHLQTEQVLNDLKAAVARTEAALGHGATPNDVLRRRSDYVMEKLARAAKRELMITGTTLAVFGLIRQSIADCVDRGCKVKLMPLDPWGHCFDSTCRSLKVDPATMGPVVIATLGEIRTFVQELPPAKQGLVEVRLLDLTPSVGCTALDMDSPTGTIVEQTYLYNVAPDEARYMTLTPDNDHDWYVQSRKQLQELWSVAKPYPLDAPAAAVAQSAHCANNRTNARQR